MTIRVPSLPELENIIDAASYGLETVGGLYNAQGPADPAPLIKHHHIEWVIQVRDQLTKLLADFEDGGAFNLVTSGRITFHTLDALRHYEQIASDLLDAVTWDGSPADKCEALAPGRYRVTRTLVPPDDMPRIRSVECANPAYGTLLLDEWEDAFMRRWDEQAV